jgi:hypothetical protein
MFFRPLAHFKKKIVAALSAFVPSLVYDLDAANYSAVPTNGTTVAGTGAYTIATSATNSRITWSSDNSGLFRSNFGGDGIGDFITGGPNWGSGQSYTIFMAYRLNTASVGPPGNTANYGRLLNSNTSSPDFLMGGYSGYPRALFINGVTVNLTGTARDTGVWRLDWAVINGVTKKADLYSATSTQPTAIIYTATNASISGFNQLRLFAKSDGNECAPGDIAFVKVYDGVLDLATIQALYTTHKARFGY